MTFEVNYKELLERNPDDQRALYELSRITKKQWIYDLNNSKAQQILGIRKEEYSDICAYSEEEYMNINRGEEIKYLYKETNLKAFLTLPYVSLTCSNHLE